MSISGFVESTIRKINNAISKAWRKVTGALRRGPEPDEMEVPSSWVRGSRRAAASAAPVKGQLKVKGNRVLVEPKKRKLYRIPWLRTFKRGLAAVLLLMNFAVSQFMLANKELFIMTVFFFGNVFILIDYLWKTRTREAQ